MQLGLLGQWRGEIADDSVDSHAEVDHLVRLAPVQFALVGFDGCVDLADRRFPSEFGAEVCGGCGEGLESCGALLDLGIDVIGLSLHSIGPDHCDDHQDGDPDSDEREGFTPEARGMAAALPYVDELVAGGTARNLEELINLLQESQSAQGAAIAS